MKHNNILHVRMLYGLTGGILLICLGLFISDMYRYEEDPYKGKLPTFNSDYALMVTNLPCTPMLYQEEHPIEGLPEGMSANAYINRYDVNIYTNSETIDKEHILSWVLVLQIFNVVAIVAIVILVVVALISFYRSTTRGQVFPTKNVSLLLIIGVMLVLFSLSMDTRTYLERRMVYNLLRDTQWMPQVRYTIHFIRIFFGLTLIFLSQIIRIGRELQEEQELTV